MNQIAARLKPHKKLALPLGLYLILVILYLAVIPPGESPDEPGHLQCIEQVSQLKRLPQHSPPPPGDWWARESIISARMCYHMPLFYLAGGVVQMAVEPTIGGTLDYQFAPSNPDGPTPFMFLHNDDDLFLGLTEPATSTFLRLFQILLGGIIIVLTYQFSLDLFPEKVSVALAAAVLLAGWPQFLFLSRAISNDILTAVLSLATLVTIIKLGNPNRYLWAAALAGLAVLTKTTAVFAAAALVAAFALELFVNRDQYRRYIKPGVGLLVIFGLVGAIILLNPTINGNLSRSAASFTSISDDALSISYWLDVFRLTLRSGVAHLGWMNVEAPAVFIYGWWLFIGVGLVIGAWQAVRNLRGTSSQLKLLFIGIWLLGILITYARINLNRFQPQMRFVLVLLPIISTFTVYGYSSLLPSHQRFVKRGILLFGVTLIAINIGILFFLIIPTYRPDL